MVLAVQPASGRWRMLRALGDLTFVVVALVAAVAGADAMLHLGLVDFLRGVDPALLAGGAVGAVGLMLVLR